MTHRLSKLIGKTVRALLPAAEEGQGLVEYALVILFIAIACVAAVTTLGGTLRTAYQSFAAAIP